MNFNPRTPRGVRPLPPIVAVMVYSFQSTHPSRGATREQGGAAGRHRISIHAPLAGCDHYEVCHARKTWWISIHAPLAGCDAFFTGAVSRDGISIHAPLAGCDPRSCLRISGTQHFNPRTPYGVRRAPRSACSCLRHFNPRTPCGVRRQCSGRLHGHRHFNPRTPCGVRRPAGSAVIEGIVISIHAPLAGCDLDHDGGKRTSRNISIHAPLAGCDLTSVAGLPEVSISIHAPLAGCDSKNTQIPLCTFVTKGSS